MKRQALPPLRKYLFYGLTIVLISAFIFLAVQGRRMEKERLQQGSEIVQQYAPTPTRVLAPYDLEILKASMILPQGSEKTGRQGTVRHRIEIRNSGTVSYCEIQLNLSYLDAGGTVILTIPHNIKERIRPGGTLLSPDISIDNIPAEAIDCRPKIVYADIEPGE
ncbi:MAG: hypothetical protein JXR49_14060 [Acidobacteria bacterium]|nr:hypothetical protein [Acidobacteriota bacterium]